MHLRDVASLACDDFVQPIHFVGRRCRTPSYRRFTGTPAISPRFPRTRVILHDGNGTGTRSPGNPATQLAGPSLARMDRREPATHRTRIRAPDTRKLEQ